ncbi:MAG: nodulation protein NfeD [Candidatus Sericytochromatia bacterium]|nr:nodulation protein NfeD [Candidatus Tanganyikabacteria bacterium]
MGAGRADAIGRLGLPVWQRLHAVTWLLRLGLLLAVLGGVGVARAAEAPLMPAAPRRAVTWLAWQGPIGPVASTYLARGLREAVRDGDGLVVLRLDGPGGLDTSMRTMVQDMLAAPLPVVVWVAPGGARAASAGMFLVPAAHRAYMAPQTAMGVAHPVGPTGEALPGPLDTKAVQDAAALARSLARQHGRDARWAESAVRESLSLSAEEAMRRGLLDGLAASEAELLARLDGVGVRVLGRRVRLRGDQALSHARGVLPGGRMLAVLSEPTTAMLLRQVGMLGIFLALSHPGSILPGLAGILGLSQGFYDLGALPGAWAGIALLVVGVGLFVAEAMTPGHGLQGVGAGLALAAGWFVLAVGARAAGWQSDAWLWTGAVGGGVLLGCFSVLAARSAWGALHARPIHEQVGRVAMVIEAAGADEGMVLLEGERWRARWAGRRPGVGEPVVVTGRNRLVLEVRRGGPDVGEARGA